MSEKKIALITGANKGIGFEICRQLAELGCTVLLGARNKERGEMAASQLQAEGLDVIPVRVDMSDDASYRELRDWLAATSGRLDILVNNAGIGNDWACNATDVPISLLRETFEVNYFFTCRPDPADSAAHP